MSLCFPLLGFLSRGFEEDSAGEADEADEAVAGNTEDEGDTEDVAQGKTVFCMTGPHSEAAPAKLVVVDI